MKVPKLVVLNRPERIHAACNTGVSSCAGLTFLAHFVSPELEALAFFITGVLAVWVADLERTLRHHHHVDRFCGRKKKQSVQH